jgi:PmbA protein
MYKRTLRCDARKPIIFAVGLAIFERMRKMTNYSDTLAQLLDDARKLGATQADAILLGSTDISIGRRLGQLEELERAESKGIGLRVLVGQRQSTVSSSDLSRDSLKELAERAVAIAKQAPEDPYLCFADNDLLAGKAKDLGIEDSSEEPSAEWLLARCAEAEEAALAVAGITNSEGASANFSRHQVALAISTGFAQEYGQTSASLSVSVLAGEGTGMERDYDYALVRHVCDLPDASQIGRNAAKYALARLNPRRVPTCQVPVIFDPRVGRSLLGNFTAAISGASVARGTSFLKDAMNTRIFGEQIKIIDDPLLHGGLGSKPFDGEGVVGHKLALVEKGELKHWLLDCRSAKQLGLKTNGRAGRSISSSPSPSATNTYIAAGTHTPDEMMAEIKNGFYVTETFGMGINLLTGDYSQGAAGFWIENGKKAYAVSEMTIAGKLQDMFLQMTPANDLEFRYRTNTPTLRVEKMTVAGS